MLKLERCFTEGYIPTETQPPSQIKNYHVHGKTAKATFSQQSVRLTKNKTLNHWNKEKRTPEAHVHYSMFIVDN